MDADEWRWYGRPIRELSRDELEAAFVAVAQQNREYLLPQAIRARAIGEVEMLRRGERELTAPTMEIPA